MKLDIYLNYPGTCAAAFRCYERHLGGKITMMRTHEDQPNQPGVPADWKKAILHARVEIAPCLPCLVLAILNCLLSLSKPLDALVVSLLDLCLDRAELVSEKGRTRARRRHGEKS